MFRTPVPEAETCDAGAAAGGKLQSVERRAWVRYPRRLTTLWQFFGGRGNESWSAEIQDISQAGVGLLINRCFAPATVLSLRVQLKGRAPNRPLLLRVKHCTSQPGGDWLAGCTFIVPLTEEELRGLVS
jgi:hypothetical protein